MSYAAIPVLVGQVEAASNNIDLFMVTVNDVVEPVVASLTIFEAAWSVSVAVVMWWLGKRLRLSRRRVALVVGSALVGTGAVMGSVTLATAGAILVAIAHSVKHIDEVTRGWKRLRRTWLSCDRVERIRTKSRELFEEFFR